MYMPFRQSIRREVETEPSLPLEVSVIDPAQPIPAAPAVLSSARLTRTTSPSVGMLRKVRLRTIFTVRRSETDNYELIGRTRETAYTDHEVLTTIPYYYKVTAVSAGGISPPSETLVTPAVTVLDRQMEYLHRALTAVKTDEGVYVSWRMLGTDSDTIAFNLYRSNQRLMPLRLQQARTMWIRKALWIPSMRFVLSLTASRRHRRIRLMSGAAIT